MFDSRVMEDDAASTAQTRDALACIECGEENPEVARGWRAYTLEGELLIYCPACASREFDDAD
jgi:DNA-directed RNA polymerase subunit RPC12/RpoP